MKIVVADIEILIAEIDVVLIQKYNWSLNNSGYLQTWFNGKMQSLHRVIAERMGLDLSNEIDHRDLNKRNYHRDNLRAATLSQNKANKKKQKNNTSGFKGVSWYKRDKKWEAQICCEGKRIRVGYFDDKEDAARAYDKAAIQYFGEFANLNFPRE